MRDTLFNQTKDKVRILGYYQLIGGILGIFLWIRMLVNLAELTGLDFLFVLMIVGLFSYSIYAGLMTIKFKGNWILHSQINQIIQIFNISLLGYSFYYISGLGLYFGFDLTQNFLFKFHFYISACNLAYNSSSDTIIVEFNIIAIAVLYLISKLELMIKSENDIRKI